MKCVLKIVVWIVAVVVALVLALPLWIGPVVRPIANAVVPTKTGTAFHLGVFGLNPYVGRLTVGDVQLGNPEGCDQREAFTLGNLFVDVDMSTALSDTIVLEDIRVSDIFVSYVSTAKGENNFKVIRRNVSGEAPGDAASDTVEASAKAQAPSAPKSEKSAGDKPGKKIIIDHLKIEKILVQLGPLTLPLPGLELNGIGRKTMGVTVREAWDEVFTQVTGQIQALGGNVGALAGALGEKGGKRAKKAIGLVNALLSQGAEAGGKTTGKAVNAVGDTTGKAVDAAGEQVEKTVNALKGLFK